MTTTLTVLAESAEAETKWAAALERALPGAGVARIESFSATQRYGQVVFVDGACPNLSELLDRIERGGRAVFLIVPEGSGFPAALQDSHVDDVIVHPFRSLEILSKLRHYQQILMWEEVSRLNSSFTDLVERLRLDLRLAESLQKARLPIRFPEIKGFKVSSRYMAGMRSGGDYIDLAEAKDAHQLSIVLSDSSSYGLSSAVLSTLMRVVVKLSSEESRSGVETVRRIHDDLARTLGERDKLSLFYGVVTRKDFKLRYVNLGTSSAFHSAGAGGMFRELKAQGKAITQNYVFPESLRQGEVQLGPDDRLALISDGFVEAAGGSEEMCELLDRFRGQDPADSLNELVFKVKSKFAEPDDMPEQDCTAVVFDVDSRILRLSSN